MYSWRSIFVVVAACVSATGIAAAVTEIETPKTTDANHITATAPEQCALEAAAEDITFVSCGGFF